MGPRAHALAALFAGQTGSALLALVLGVAFVAGYDAALGPSRYPYSGDSASYIEMASSLRETGRPRVTPWEVTRGEADAVPQPLFPPGFAIAIAAFVPLAGDARSAALWPGRIAAALLPLLLVVAWRGVASPPALLFAGLWVLLSPGVRRWQFIAYSDVTALALSVVALGILARALRDPERARARAWLLAGLVAGLAYTVRNAALALLAASLAALLYARLRGFTGSRPLALFALGAAVPVGALNAYNLATFGTAWPYTMPPSVRPWTLNVGDYAAAQLDEVGVGRLLGASEPGAWALAALAALLGVAAWLWWRTRAERERHLVLSLLGLYAVGGGALLVASRSRYEWGNVIDERNVLQLSFALVLAAVVALEFVPRTCRRIALVVLFGFLALRGAAAVEEVRIARHSPPEQWLALDRDAAVIAAVRDLPRETLIASNTAVLFRIGAGRAVRQLDVGGADKDFAGSLALLGAAATRGSATFVLVCNEWTWEFSACRTLAPDGEPACRRVRPREPIVALCPVKTAPGA